MKIIVIAALTFALGYFAFQKATPYLLDQLAEVGSTKITRKLAVENVKKLPEVQNYLKEVPNGKVETDNEEEGEYNVHVYEVKNGHTATFNWYRVSIKNGEVSPQLPNGKGKISGKLCYPSEVVPEGIIEAKRLSDGKVFILNHGSSLEDELGTKYSFKLEQGEYYLRYKTKGGLIGYSTTVCPTGNEETCGDKKQRQLVKATVEPNAEVSNYDICDYYYSDSNAPKF